MVKKYNGSRAWGSLFVVLAFFSIRGIDIVSQGAEGPSKEEIKKNDKVVWEALVVNGISFVPHDSVCSLALVDKNCNNLIKKTAMARKEYVVTKLKQQQRVLTWHIHGSAGTDAYVKQATKGFSLVLSRFCLGIDGIIEKRSCWDGSLEDIKGCFFRNMLPSLTSPFFSHKGDVCCYGIAESRCNGDEWSQTIRQYLITADGTGKSVQCVVSFNDEHQTVWDCLNCLIEFPVLLKAILNSTHVTEKDDIKTYHLDGVVVPNNYGTPAENSQGGYLSFDMLPNLLRDAVKARYFAQKK